MSFDVNTFLILSAVVGYILGSVPFGLIFTKLAGLGDIRKIGSGNIGATNVLRTGHKGLALMTLICDSGKAAFAAFLAIHFAPEGYAQIAGLLAGTFGVIGHNFPIWLKFKGGKGVASTLGMILVVTPLTGLLTCITWLMVALIFKYSSLAALIALIMAPLYAFFFASAQAVYFLAFLAVLAIIRHHKNIKNLLAGTETKIGAKKH